MSTDVWITLITAVIAPVALRIAAHYWPTVQMPAPVPADSAGTGVYDVEADDGEGS